MISGWPPGFRYRRDPATGEEYLEVPVRGEVLTDLPLLNKGTAFTEQERDALGLRGLLPPRVASMEQQLHRVEENYRRKTSDLERYIYLMGLLDRNQTLFYRLLLDRLEELLPVVYTPSVGLACEIFGHIYRRSRGLYLTLEDRGRVESVLANWPGREIGVVVVTDGERVLGLGDLGAGGMGISIGKIALYVAAAGIHPARTLPVCLDVGTDNEALLADPLYLGTDRRRVRGQPYEELVEAFVRGVGRCFPRALVQFEDFATDNAFRLLERYRNRLCCFNDDIQGTGAVTRAGVIAGLRASGGGPLARQRVLIAGAGSAGIGVARALGEAEVWVVDAKGLLTLDRDDLSVVQREFARAEPSGSLLEIARRVRPTVLVGASGVPGLFTREVIGTLAGPRPMIFALSNPTSKAECIPEQVREQTGGRVLVATGSPFPDTPQCNNVYVFPGVGLGVMVARARRVTDEMFCAAADALASLAPPGGLYPPLREIRRVSAAIALAVARTAVANGVAEPCDDDTLRARLQRELWEPRYLPYRPAPEPAAA